MSNRYFVGAPITSERVTLTGPEAHHLSRVMRAAPGTEVVLFDDGGAEFMAIVEAVRRGEIELSVTERIEADRELSREVVLAVALPKGERQRWLVEKLVELGCRRLVLLSTERGVARPSSSSVERLARTVIEAAKQCGRNRLMEIAGPLEWADYVAASDANDGRFVAHPASAGGAAAVSTSELANHPRFAGLDPVHLAIGPEGGFTLDEINTATGAGWELVDFGPRILRVETAAVHLASLAAACTRAVRP